MKCMQCDGEMERSSVPYSVDRKGYHLYLRDIPAFVCSQCGENYFPEDDVDAIQSVITTLEQQIEKLQAA